MSNSKDPEILSSHTYEKVFEETKASGSTTHKGEQRHKAGKGLDEHVDPKGFGVIRRSLNRMEELPNKLWKLMVGIAMLVEFRFDTTGSMGGNVDRAFKALPRLYDLLKNKVLARYDLQIITSIFGDASDSYILCRSQAEMGKKIAEQMTMMVPEKSGGDLDEDPQYGIFGSAYLTSADTNLYGLKSYDFTITDAAGRDRFSVTNLKRVFGELVFEKLTENGYKITEEELPDLKQVVKDLLEKKHGFVILVGNVHESTRSFWHDFYSKERVMYLHNIDLLPEIQSAIIGLTEGVLTLSNLEDFLITEAKISEEDAKLITRAVAGIPMGLQQQSENFHKIPVAGNIFQNKRDLYPIPDDELVDILESTEEPKSKRNKTSKGWL